MLIDVHVGQGQLHLPRPLNPNRLEAELLSGVRITDEDSLNRAADKLLDKAGQAEPSAVVRRQHPVPAQGEEHPAKARVQQLVRRPVQAHPPPSGAPSPCEG